MCKDKPSIRQLILKNEMIETCEVQYRTCYFLSELKSNILVSPIWVDRVDRLLFYNGRNIFFTVQHYQLVPMNAHTAVYASVTINRAQSS